MCKRNDLLVLMVSVVVFLAVCGRGYCAVLNVPSPGHPTIQSAIDAAVNGDEVIVAAGIYTGPGNSDIKIESKAITIKSTDGPESCIIDCQGNETEPHRGFTFSDNGSVLDGFTITNGYGTNNYAGGIFCTKDGTKITNCIVSNNSGKYAGGISILGNNTIISNCFIVGNNSYGVPENSNWGEGGGISSIGYQANTTLRNCVIAGNTAGEGAGVLCSSTEGSITITNCTIVDNIARNRGG